MNKPIILLLLILGISHTGLFAQQYYMPTVQGYAAGTTGGGSASPITVSTYSALKTALTSSSPAVILVSGTIDFASSGMIKAAIKDKTLIGLPGAKFVNNDQSTSGILYLNGASSNVIIRNILFQGPGARDNNGNDNLTLKPATKVWVDHCEFQDGEDGNLDISDLADNVTVSWCKFTYLKTPRPAGPNGGTTPDHRFSDLIGGDDSDAPSDKKYSVTWMNCYWAEGCKERMPRARNSQLHILNCYYNTSVSGAVGMGLGGGANGTTCYAENTHFEKITNMYKNYSGTVDLTYSGCIPAGTKVGTTVAKPTYTYNVYAADLVATAVPNTSCGAGPTLKVTSNGVMSSSCIVDGLNSTNEENAVSLVYPNPNTGSSFNIRSRENIKSLSVINVSGKIIFYREDIQQGIETTINADIEEGMYVIKLQNVSGTTETIKYVRAK